MYPLGGAVYGSCGIPASRPEGFPGCLFSKGLGLRAHRDCHITSLASKSIPCNYMNPLGLQRVEEESPGGLQIEMWLRIWRVALS